MVETTSSVEATPDGFRPPSTSDTEEMVGVSTTTTTQSPGGSPPLPPLMLDTTSKSTSQQDQNNHDPNNASAPFPPAVGTRAFAGLIDRPVSYSRPFARPHGSTRRTSAAGGTQVVLNETGSWSGMANQSSSLVGAQGKAVKPSGVLAFLKGKKGRERSPKPNQQRGVIGKEGARVIVGS